MSKPTVKGLQVLTWKSSMHDSFEENKGIFSK